MGLCSWVIFGGLAGWLASVIMGADDRSGCLFYVVVGVVGAFLGGLIMDLVGGDFGRFAFNFRSFAVAVLGAVVLLAITGASRRR
jgi:uncharacterized membrane protein YeaQ/YmgE (transglycosylase-associated protein family)